jgi:hypothetical protein
MGDPSGWRGRERNMVWRRFLGPPSRSRQTPEERHALDVAQVGDLRTAAARYPTDQPLRRLIADLRANSVRFAKLWDRNQFAAARRRRGREYPARGRLS